MVYGSSWDWCFPEILMSTLIIKLISVSLGGLYPYRYIVTLQGLQMPGI